ncbi:dephospho-CoA kinase [Paraflavitalea soli]|uniref:Dephospho-CoA kinase n=1 Tax=Paraflavitalea soli TaxID=2315862 RepID=A0A3B7MIG7_9BACT|nr:dephospho-CoA kinase [Paraflavitalea soli]AXY73019.1 dephospho-CoA kinase [Paraflavitalea soli]
MALRVGLTGGIGSGKSTVAKVFEVLGIPVYYADEAARHIMNADPLLREQIIQHFGDDAYDNNILNRKYLAGIVFNDPAKLELLNSLVHPATIRDGEKWMQAQTTPYAVKEAALIFESGSQSQLDYVIGVSAPDALRIHRTMQRDHITREDVIARMSKQVKQVIKMRLCDFVVYNDEQQPVIPQVLKLHEQLLALSQQAVSA